MNLYKILVSAAALFVAYVTVATIAPEPTLKRYQQQWDANAGKAQRFLYVRSKVGAPSVVLTGSSMSDRFPDYRYGACFYNLAFAGDSALTGLELISRLKNPPSMVLVETNTIDRKIDTDFLDSVDSFLPRHSPVFRVDYKPINFFLSELYSFNHSPESAYLSHLSEKSDAEVRKVSLDAAVRNQQSRIDAKSLQRQIEKLQLQLKKLSMAGSKVIFLKCRLIATCAIHRRQHRLELQFVPLSQKSNISI